MDFHIKMETNSLEPEYDGPFLRKANELYTMGLRKYYFKSMKSLLFKLKPSEGESIDPGIFKNIYQDDLAEDVFGLKLIHMVLKCFRDSRLPTDSDIQEWLPK